MRIMNSKKRMKRIKEKKRIKYAYGLYIIGLVLLIVIALFLPQIIFALQDNYRMTGTETEARSSLDISQLNASYELQTNARIKYFLNMNRKNVTSIEYKFAEESEMAELLEGIFSQEWFAPFYEYGLIPRLHYEVFLDDTSMVRLQDCKKYIVSGNDYHEGIALMMWYFDLYLSASDTRVQLLADTETNTIYYVKLTRENHEVEAYDSESSQVVTYVKSNKEKTTEWDYLTSFFAYYISFYDSYYETDGTISYEFYDINDINNGNTWFYESSQNGDRFELSLALPYGELSMNFIVYVTSNIYYYPDITIGLAPIGELIPEMMQD